LADRVVSDAVEDIGSLVGCVDRRIAALVRRTPRVAQIGLRIDAAHLGGLCRTPDYAELAPPSRRLPLVCVYIIRHSLTVDRLPTWTGEWPLLDGDLRECPRCNWLCAVPWS
jgi:hypothetical protein